MNGSVYFYIFFVLFRFFVTVTITGGSNILNLSLGVVNDANTPCISAADHLPLNRIEECQRRSNLIGS